MGIAGPCRPIAPPTLVDTSLTREPFLLGSYQAFLHDRLGVIPWRSVRFLDDAASRALLYKDGGGYRFIHRLFLDYCANLECSATGNIK